MSCPVQEGPSCPPGFSPPLTHPYWQELRLHALRPPAPKGWLPGQPPPGSTCPQPGGGRQQPLQPPGLDPCRTSVLPPDARRRAEVAEGQIGPREGRIQVAAQLTGSRRRERYPTMWACSHPGLGSGLIDRRRDPSLPPAGQVPFTCRLSSGKVILISGWRNHPFPSLGGRRFL